MSKKERVKSTINILTAVIIAFLTALFSILGYTLMNYNVLDVVRAAGIVVGAVFLIAGLALFIVALLRNLKRLEKMK